MEIVELDQNLPVMALRKYESNRLRSDWVNTSLIEIRRRAMTQSNVSSDHFVEVLDVVEDDRIQLARRQAEGQATVAHRQSVSGALARPVAKWARQEV